MKQNDDGWEWKEISFTKWRSIVNRRLQDIYLIGVDGIDDERLTSLWQMKQAPYEFDMVCDQVRP